MVDEVTRIDAPSRELFEREFLNLGRPVIITGVCSRWPAASSWSFDHLAHVAGPSRVSVRFEERGDFHRFYNQWIRNFWRRTRKMALRDYIDGLADDATARTHYLAEYPLRLVSPQLLEEIDFPGYFDRELTEARTLFVGRNTFSPNHFHPATQAMLCQVRGTKEVQLYAPDQFDNLYPHRWFSPAMNFSHVDAADPDVDRRYPKFKQARSVSCLVHAGEILFIPVHWWHAIRSPGENIAVTFFWTAQRETWRFPSPGREVLAWQATVGRVVRLAKRLGAV
jgi:hypothetical protein